jgi:hypothetical protein
MWVWDSGPQTDKHLPQSPVTVQFFWMTTFCIAFYKSYLSTGGGGGFKDTQNIKDTKDNHFEPGLERQLSAIYLLNELLCFYILCQ